MKKYSWFLSAALFVGCLGDGRPEADYLRDYAARVDPSILVEDAGEDAPGPVGEIEILTEESDRCSPPMPAETFLVEVRNQGDVTVDFNLVDDACEESFHKRLHLISRQSLTAWPDVVFRVRDSDSGEFQYDFIVTGPVDGEQVIP